MAVRTKGKIYVFNGERAKQNLRKMGFYILAMLVLIFMVQSLFGSLEKGGYKVNRPYETKKEAMQYWEEIGE
jgi:hypothetical protein